MKDLYFFICDNKRELEFVYKGDNLMSEIIEESKKIAGIMDLDLYMSDEELLKMDQDHYYQKGIIETKKEMIINMYKANIDINKISECSNLSINEIKDIINNKN